MKSLTSNTKYKTISNPAKFLRAASALTLITASGVSAYAQESGFEQNRFYQESAESHKIFSFKFDESGVDERSVSFLESQKEIDFKNSIYSGKTKTSISREDRDYLFKESHTYEPSTLKKSLELTAGLSQIHVTSPRAVTVTNPKLERFKPHDLIAFSQDRKATTSATVTPLFASKNSLQLADAGKANTYSRISETAMLP